MLVAEHFDLGAGRLIKCQSDTLTLTEDDIVSLVFVFGGGADRDCCLGHESQEDSVSHNEDVRARQLSHVPGVPSHCVPGFHAESQEGSESGCVGSFDVVVDALVSKLHESGFHELPFCALLVIDELGDDDGFDLAPRQDLECLPGPIERAAVADTEVRLAHLLTTARSPSPPIFGEFAHRIGLRLVCGRVTEQPHVGFFHDISPFLLLTVRSELVRLYLNILFI